MRDGGRREQRSKLGLGESGDVPRISRGPLWQMLRAPLGKGQRGTIEEEKGYDLYFRKDTMAAMGEWFRRRSDWRPGDPLEDGCSNQDGRR